MCIPIENSSIYVKVFFSRVQIRKKEQKTNKKVISRKLCILHLLLWPL